MKPLILDFKIYRKETPTTLAFEYSHSESLNVVTQNGKTTPFIEINSNDLEFQTKTKVYRESDDHHSTVELKTKTEVKRERDDLHDSILELETKTFIRREQDE